VVVAPLALALALTGLTPLADVTPRWPSVDIRAAAAASGSSSVQVLHLPSADGDTQTRDVWVYRPPGPDRSSLPVLWFLHGMPGGPRDVFDAGLPHAMDSWIASGGTPFVVASPDGNGSAHPDTEWADSVDGADRLESFIVKIAVPAVEGDHQRDRDHRGIAGFSMGGYGAANLGTRHPDLFSQVVTFDGYFHVDDPSGVFAGDAATIDANSPDQHADRARVLRTLMVDGTDDNQSLTAGESSRFKGLLDRAGAFSELVTPPGDHSWGFVAGQLFAMQGFLNASWRCDAATDPPGAPAPASGRGYWVLGADGGVFAFDAPFLGSLPALGLRTRGVALAASPSGGGYWVLGPDGGVFAFGDARYVGSLGGKRLNAPAVSLTPTPSGNGYWILTADGGVFAFGDAAFDGATADLRLNAPVVAMTASPTGAGYWLVAADGGVFAFGDARYSGSTAALHLTSPVVSMAAPLDGRGGYWLMAADGGVFSFSAGYHGGLPGTVPCQASRALRLRTTDTSEGYWTLTADGAVYSFGDAAFHGAAGGMGGPGGVVDLAVRR
jgi:S-formylglutathione hydrolase FrmB